MYGFGVVLFILIMWLCISIPVSKMNQAGKNDSSSPNRAVSGRDGAASEQKQAIPAAGAQTPLKSVLAPSVMYGSHDDSLYQGSLNAVTGEGYDPCHESDLHGLNEAEVPVMEPLNSTPSLPFGWTGSDMVKGIVISEILKRR